MRGGGEEGVNRAPKIWEVGSEKASIDGHHELLVIHLGAKGTENFLST